MPNVKVLLLYAPCGAGHEKSARALYEYFKSNGLGDIILRDILEFAPVWYRKVYRDGYYFLIRKYPKIWSLLYQSTEGKGRKNILNKIIGKISNECFNPFYEYLRQINPSVILSTHFLPISLLESFENNFKLYIVITDYFAHSLWIGNNVDKYLIGSSGVKDILIKKGIKEDRISLTGIPIKYTETMNLQKEEARQKLGIKENLFTILLLTGAGGVGDISSIIRNIEKLDGHIQLLVNTGLNEKIEKRLQKEYNNTPVSLKIFGFTSDIYQYYAASDLVITKPGGLTVTECLAFGKPMIMYNAIPGQEVENARFVANSKAGIIADDINEIRNIIENFLSNPDMLEEMRNNALKISPKSPNEKILNEIKSNVNYTV